MAPSPRDPAAPLVRLHEGGGVLAVAKPAGLPTQAPIGIDSVESRAREQRFGPAFRSATVAGRHRHPGGFLGVPHRLDRAVSGVLLLATTPRAARQLSRQFERRRVRKTYLAVLVPSGVVPPPPDATLQWHDTIHKVADEPRAEVVPRGTPGGREATTTGRVRSAADGTLMVELEPLTGRMHQLRVQAAARGMPVLGDVAYGGPPLASAQTTDPHDRAIALHAWRITFLDPETAAEVTLTCPPPDLFPWQRPL